MRVIIRVDASIRIGSGHVMRCLTLADGLRERSAEVVFICREHSGHMADFIAGKGYVVHRLAAVAGKDNGLDGNPYAPWLGVHWRVDAEETLAVLRQVGGGNWLVVDHYALDWRWEELLRPSVGRIMVIDDLADRAHDCDLLLDQNQCDDMEARYADLLPAACLKFLGPRHILLRTEFLDAAKTSRRRDGIIRRVLLFFGGMDLTNETEKALEALLLVDLPGIHTDVVVGGANPNRERIEAICRKTKNISFYCDINTMAQLMTTADLSLGAGGSAMWERCCLSLPSITVIVAENQAVSVCALAEVGATWSAGWYMDADAPRLAELIGSALVNPEMLLRMSEKCRQLMQGCGPGSVIDALMEG